MSGFKHLLPSSTFRAAVCVSVAVGTSLFSFGDGVSVRLKFTSGTGTTWIQKW